MGRIIGIRHRRKKTRQGEARPTMVAIKGESGYIACLELEDDTAELDFLMSRFPVEWRSVEPEEDISSFRPHQCKWRKVKKDEDASNLHSSHLLKTMDEKGFPVLKRVVKVPVVFEGLSEGDEAAMVLGGSGDRFAAGLSRRGEDIGVKVYRIPPFSLSNNRGTEDKENDHLTLLRIFEQKPKLFYQVMRRDRDLIRVKEALSARQDALKARIACEQRILQSLVGRIFLNEEGFFPEGVIKDQYDSAKANDLILKALLEEEKRRDKNLAAAVQSLDIWEKIFKGIEGVGPRLAAGIIAPIANIRRFMVEPDYFGADTPEEKQKRRKRAVSKGAAKLKKFCGVHVMEDGRFPRQRAGKVSNWSPQARQALFLLAKKQFNYRPDSVWGRKLLQNKLAFRQRHPEPIEVEVKGNGKSKTVKRYTKDHIHKMAIWRTLTRFVEWLYKQWIRIENEKSEV